MSCPAAGDVRPGRDSDDAVHRGEPLQMGGRPEPAHLPLPAGGLIDADFRAIVFVLLATVDHGGSRYGDAAEAAQFVCDQPARLAYLGVSTASEELVWPPADCAATARECLRTSPSSSARPQILLLPLDLHEELVQIPECRPGGPGGGATQPCVVEPERPAPTAGSPFIRHGDTPFGKEIWSTSRGSQVRRCRARRRSTE